MAKQRRTLQADVELIDTDFLSDLELCRGLQKMKELEAEDPDQWRDPVFLFRLLLAGGFRPNELGTFPGQGPQGKAGGQEPREGLRVDQCHRDRYLDGRLIHPACVFIPESSSKTDDDRVVVLDPWFVPYFEARLEWCEGHNIEYVFWNFQRKRPYSLKNMGLWIKKLFGECGIGRRIECGKEKRLSIYSMRKTYATWTALRYMFTSHLPPNQREGLDIDGLASNLGHKFRDGHGAEKGNRTETTEQYYKRRPPSRRYNREPILWPEYV